MKKTTHFTQIFTQFEGQNIPKEAKKSEEIVNEQKSSKWLKT